MRHVRCQDEGQRNDRGRDETLALPKVRRIERSQARQRSKGARAALAMAALQGRDRRPQGQQDHVLEEDRLDMEDMADSALHRRGARRRLPGRDPTSQKGRRAHSGRRRARRRLASRPDGMRLGMGRAHAQGPCSQDGRLRRVAGLCQGGGRRLAGDAHPALHLPRRRAGEEMHDAQAEAGGGNRAFGHRQQARRCKGRRWRHRMAFGVQRMVREVGVASQGVHVQRRQEGLRARALAQGQAHPEQARQGRHAVRLRGDGARARRRMALHQQRRRERQRAASRHAQASPRASLAQPRQGDLLVVLCAHRKPASRSRNPTRHANRRRCGRAVRRSVERIEARGRRSGRARNGDRLRGVPYAYEIQAVNNPEGHTF